MARQTVVGGSGGGFLSKVVGVLIVIALVIFVKDHPTHAAHLFSSALSWLHSAAEAGARFVDHASR